jgi:tRNA (guanine9-N1)-methyltransferase
MAGLEERPTKIRKLDMPSELSQGNPACPEAPEMAFLEATSNQLEDEGDTPFQDGQDARDGRPKLSKSQMKKLKKKEQWEAGREYRKAKRREKHHEKQTRKKEQRQQLQAKIANGEAIEIPKKLDESKLKYPRRPIQVPVSLILDCDFNELMFEKELISLGAQLTRCYSENRKNPYRSHLALSSWGGALKSRFETVLTNNHLSWKGVKFFEEDFVVAADCLDEVMRSTSGGTLAGAFVKGVAEPLGTKPDLCHSMIQNAQFEEAKETNAVTENVRFKVNEAPQSISGDTTVGTVSGFVSTVKTHSEPQQGSPSHQGDDAPREESHSAYESEKTAPSIVYLTADSPHTLEYLSPHTCYIIGGIVDKNRHKGLCYKRACERGIPTAKLPIGEYMTMQSRSVLAVNHVVEIMLKWLVTGDWGEAFLSVIPKRKDAKLKLKKWGENQRENQREEEEDEEEEESEDEEDHETPIIPPQKTKALDEVDVKEPPEREDSDPNN